MVTDPLISQLSHFCTHYKAATLHCFCWFILLHYLCFATFLQGWQNIASVQYFVQHQCNISAISRATIRPQTKPKKSTTALGGFARLGSETRLSSSNNWYMKKIIWLFNKTKKGLASEMCKNSKFYLKLRNISNQRCQFSNISFCGRIFFLWMEWKAIF